MVAVFRRQPVREGRQEPVKFGQTAGRFGGLFGRAVVAGAGDEFEKLVDVMVQLQDGFVFIDGGHEFGDGEGFGGEALLYFVCEPHLTEVVFAARTAFEYVLALFGDEHHFGRAAVAAGERSEAEDYADVVMAEDANELLGGKLCAASGHKFPDCYFFPMQVGEDIVIVYLNAISMIIIRRNTAAAALRISTAIRYWAMASSPICFPSVAMASPSSS